MKTSGRKSTGQYVIVRTERAGVFAGTLHRRDGAECELRNARRLWYWSGAASLSQLAVDGVKNPRECKFPVAVGSVTLLGVIEVISSTALARKSIEAVPVWSA